MVEYAARWMCFKPASHLLMLLLRDPQLPKHGAVNSEMVAGPSLRVGWSWAIRFVFLQPVVTILRFMIRMVMESVVLLAPVPTP